MDDLEDLEEIEDSEEEILNDDLFSESDSEETAPTVKLEEEPASYSIIEDDIVSIGESSEDEVTEEKEDAEDVDEVIPIISYSLHKRKRIDTAKIFHEDKSWQATQQRKLLQSMCQNSGAGNVDETMPPAKRRKLKMAKEVDFEDLEEELARSNKKLASDAGSTRKSGARVSKGNLFLISQ